MTVLRLLTLFLLVASQAWAALSDDTWNNNPMTIGASGVEAIRIVSTSKVGIGGITPTVSLEVSGTISATTLSATIISFTAVQIVSQSASPVTCNSGNSGTLRYNSPTTTLELCNGAGWQPMGVGIPAGTISAFASTTCPTGWSEYTTARGAFLRGIDNGAGIDPSGTRPPGAFQGDLFRSHSHTASTNANQITSAVSSQSGANYGAFNGGATVTVNATGGAETRPVNVAVTFCQFNGTSNGWNSPLSTTAAGSTNDVQYNSSGSMAADTGNFTYSGSVLKAPTVSATNVYAKNISATTVSATNVSFADGTTQTTKAFSSCTTVSAAFGAASSVTASCGAGYTLTGGGVQCTTGNGTSPAYSYPSGNSWVGGYCFYYTGISYGGTAFAVCCH